MRFESSPRKGVITAGSFVSASLQGRQQRQCAEGEKEAQVSVLPTTFLLGFYLFEDPAFLWVFYPFEGTSFL